MIDGSSATGSLSATLTAGWLKSAGLMRLSTKGARSATCRPALHAGAASAVKSPASIAAVGTKPTNDAGVCLMMVP